MIIRCTSSTFLLAAMTIMIVAFNIVFSSPVIANPLTDGDSGKIQTTYRVHDVKQASFGKGVQWAIQWAYNQHAFDDLLPLFGYKIGVLDESGNIASATGPEFDRICGNINEERELDFLLALSHGKATWNPSQYELGLAGIAFLERGETRAALGVEIDHDQPRDYHEESRSNNTLRAFPFGDISWSSIEGSQNHSLTLGSVCNDLVAGYNFNMTEGSKVRPDDRSLYLLTQNPIPDFDSGSTPDFDGWAGFWPISRREFAAKTMT